MYRERQYRCRSRPCSRPGEKMAAFGTHGADGSRNTREPEMNDSTKSELKAIK